MRHLITAGLPYINGVKHLGNLIGSLLPADVYARFLRQRKHEVLYICATDEHGAPAELAAEQAHVQVKDFCEQQHQIQADIYKRFSISFDFFGRSSSKQNKTLTQQIAKKLFHEGFLKTQEMKQMYCVEDQRFLPDRYIIGTCPHCHFENARGDQCEHCTRLLSPTDLIQPRSAISGSKNLEVRTSKHLFLNLPSLEPLVRTWIEKQAPKWPSLSQQIAHKWLQEGLRDRCITRDLSWGVPVPFDGFKEKVFYVWFDAPIEYIGATWEWALSKNKPELWKQWWWDTQDVTYTQFMGKDNLPFHTIMFPAMLLGTREPWKRADQIKGFHWLTYYGGKFSTSAQRGVFTDTALELFPADYWRYFLLSHIPEAADSAFTWELFQLSIHKDLSDVLGNFINRVLTFCHSKWGPHVPEGGSFREREYQLIEDCKTQLTAFETNLEQLKFRTALSALRSLWVLGNQYINEKAPWKEIKEDKNAAALTIRTSLNLIQLFALTAAPIIPALSKKILTALSIPNKNQNDPPQKHLSLQTLAPRHPIQTLAPLIERIEDSKLKALKTRFEGKNTH